MRRNRGFKPRRGFKKRRGKVRFKKRVSPGRGGYRL